MISRPISILLAVGLSSLLSMCGFSQPDGSDSGVATIAPSAIPNAAPIASLPAAPAATVTPSATPLQTPSLWISPALPKELTQSISLPEAWTLSADPDGASMLLAVGNEHMISRYVYALVAPFPTVVDNVKSDTIQNIWSGKGVDPQTSYPPLMMDANTREVLTAWWGPPAESAVQELPTEKILDAAWEARPAWAIIPFSAVNPRWKVLSIDGVSPLRNDFAPDRYPLTVPISVTGRDAMTEQAQEALRLPLINRDPGKLTTLIMTGVTAMVRGTAALMDSKGVEYPAEEIGSTLRAADLTHISNEIPFAVGCPAPDPYSPSFFFCSDPKYIGLMDFVGTDIVELTGNHFEDHGAQATLETIDTYVKRGWQYYGGGKNFDDARKPIRVENHGNRLAFIGCNPVGPNYAWATPDQPGAAPCDDVLYKHDKPVDEYTSNYNYMEEQVRALKAEGFLPIVTFQYQEYGYYQPEPMQQTTFRRMANAGAVIVSGSQAHHPQAMDFTNSSFIHYGLGNLFFDQIVLGPEYQNAFIDRHVFYDGKYLGVELLTIRFEDQARSRFMTAEERSAFLTTVFCSSGWTEHCPPVIQPWVHSATATAAPQIPS